MTEITDGVLKEILSNVAVANNLSEWYYVRKHFETIGQNYFGIIIPVVLNGINRKMKSFNLVLKLAPTDPRYRISDAVTFLFSREVYMYDVVLKKYEEIQFDFLHESQYIIPKCYFVSKEYCKEIIVMQDMCADDYKPYTYQMFLDVEHISISLKSLAKLHALSFVLKHQDSILYDEITKVCEPLTESTNKRYIDIMSDRLSRALEKFENTDYVPMFIYLKQNISKLFDVALSGTTETCICHGDIWKENILFKYKDNVPISACLIDYQTSRISSPAFDTLYLIISSTNRQLRENHFHSLLDLYYQMFEKILTESGLSAKNAYSREMFEKDLRIVWPACLIVANTALWLSSGLQEQGHVKSKHILKTQEEKDEAVIQYKMIIKAIIDDLSTFGYQLPKDL